MKNLVERTLLTFFLFIFFQILSYEPVDTVEGVRCQTTKEFKIQLEKLMTVHSVALEKEK